MSGRGRQGGPGGRGGGRAGGRGRDDRQDSGRGARGGRSAPQPFVGRGGRGGSRGGRSPDAAAYGAMHAGSYPPGGTAPGVRTLYPTSPGQGASGSAPPQARNFRPGATSGRHGPGTGPAHGQHTGRPNGPAAKFPLVSGQVNPFLCVELERSSVWKVSVPAGQTFGKPFLAGLEAWGQQMVATYQRTPGRAPSSQSAAVPGQALAPAPAPLTAPAARPPPPPPERSAAAPPAPPPVLDWASYLSGDAEASSGRAASSLAPPPNSGIAAPPVRTATDNFYRPAVQLEAGEHGLAAQQLLAGGFLGGSSPSTSHRSDGGDWNEGEQDASDGGEDDYCGEDPEEEDDEEGDAEEGVVNQEDYHDSDGPSDSEAVGEQRDVFAAAATSPGAREAATPVASASRSASVPAVGASSAAPIAGGARVRISVRLERHALTDAELELFTRWYQERGLGLFEIAKLWLFDNRLSDAGAACIAALMHSRLTEIHLSHNAVTTRGAKLLLESVPAGSLTDAVGKPMSALWLRMEWNIINLEELLTFVEQQRAARGLKVEVPQVVASHGERGHEMNLKMQCSPHRPAARPGPAGTASLVHVCLPWVQCQKQPPREAAILQDVKNIYRSGAHRPAPIAPPPTVPAGPAAPPAPPPPPPSILKAAGTTSTAAALPHTPAPASRPTGTPAAAPTPAPPPPPPPPPADQQLLAKLSEAGAAWRPGPLLLFPDTSALLAMLGANTEAPRPLLSLDALIRLARAGQFGRQGVAAGDQVFLVVADSVMKQLDGLKSTSSARAAIRGFLSEGLEQCGPAGLDFLTVLGAHEGEGLAAQAGALGAAGSRSQFLSSKGQQVDYRIVEVALFFMHEIVKTTGGNTAGGSDCGAPPDASGAPADPRPHLPVILLSNDNAQLAAARSHGLPAFRLAGEGPDVAACVGALMRHTPGSGAPLPVLSASLLRGLLGGAATAGVGSAAPQVPLQESYDAVVAGMHAAVAALGSAASALGGIAAAVGLGASPPSSPRAALAAIRQVLQVPATEPGPAAQEQGAGTLVDALAGLLAALQAPLGEWDARCRSHQQPSRVLKWALPASSPHQQ